MYYLDSLRNADGSVIYRTKNGFDYPIRKGRGGGYVIQSGEQIRVCMTSDFFLQEADEWRPEAWRMMKMRPDVVFILITKRPGRVRECLPQNWGNGWENIFFHVTCENQRRTEERMPLLMELPFRHKGVMCAPFIGPVSLAPWLQTGQIDEVICGGENYDGARPCDFDWVKALREECVQTNTRFCFIETGTVFIKDGKRYHLASKQLQSEQAFKSGMNYEGHPIHFALKDVLGFPIPDSSLYKRQFRDRCKNCASQLICNGCANCGACDPC